MITVHASTVACGARAKVHLLSTAGIADQYGPVHSFEYEKAPRSRTKHSELLDQRRQVLKIARTAQDRHGNAYNVADVLDQVNVIALHNTVTIDRVNGNLANAQV